ncbi:hypothetical protein ACIBAI_04745 [Streptomyces sp. NPDC051041]|uniref:hypothetical protein n=1 Tax=Streptomyces sp. NPDC051041 TaxID=3365640 RepID=UPI0037A80059
MSFGDPNNPYGAPQQGQQPGYGYPQQQGQAPGYGYPQAPPVGPYGGAPAPTTMPGSVSAARVMLWVIVGLQVIGVALFAFAAVGVNAAKNDAALQEDDAFQQLADYSAGMLWALVVFALAWAVFAIVLALKFTTGGNGVRITTLVFAVITAILGIYPFILVGLVHTVLAVLVAVFVGNSNGSAWFNRPRY